MYAAVVYYMINEREKKNTLLSHCTVLYTLHHSNILYAPHCAYFILGCIDIASNPPKQKNR